MSSEEWAQELFRKDIEQTPVSERKSFLFGIIENYCEGITYVRSSSAVGYSLLLHAIYAAQIVLKNPDFEIGELDETERYKIERFVHLAESTSDGASKSEELGELKVELGKLKIKTRPTTSSPAPQRNRQPGSRKSPRVPNGLAPGAVGSHNMKVEIRSRESNPRSLDIVIFPVSAQDDSYTADLKRLIALFAAGEKGKRAQEQYVGFVEKYSTAGKSKVEIETDVANGIRSAFSQLSEIIISPRKYADHGVPVEHMRKRAVENIAKMFRNACCLIC